MSKLFCPSCGLQAKIDANFCRTCGSPLRPESAQRAKELLAKIENLEEEEAEESEEKPAPNPRSKFKSRLEATIMEAGVEDDNYSSKDFDADIDIPVLGTKIKDLARNEKVTIEKRKGIGKISEKDFLEQIRRQGTSKSFNSNLEE